MAGSNYTIERFIIFTPLHKIISRRTHGRYEEYTKNVSWKARRAYTIYGADDTEEKGYERRD